MPTGPNPKSEIRNPNGAEPESKFEKPRNTRNTRKYQNNHFHIPCVSRISRFQKVKPLDTRFKRDEAKQIRISNQQKCSKPAQRGLKHLNFGFGICFGFRISDFGFRPGPLGVAVVLSLVSFSAWAQRAVNWRSYKLADGLPESACIAISYSPQNKLLARHLTQLLISELDGYTIHTMPSSEAGKNRVYPSPGGQLWTLVPGGLEEFQDGAWRFHAIPQVAAEPHGGPTHVIDPIPLVPARQGRVLLLLPDQLAEFNAENPEHERMLGLRGSAQTRLGNFLGLCQTRDGGLWLAAQRGLAKIPGPIRNLQPQTEWREFPIPANLPVHDLKMPHETPEGGVLCLAESSTNSQRAVVWFDGQNWDMWVPGTEKLRQVWAGSDRNIWAMTIDSLFELDTTRSELTPNEEISPRQFFDVALEPGGAFWLATSDGLFRYAPALWRKPAPLRQLNSPVRCLAADSQERLWFIAGTSVDSLLNGRVQHYPLPVNGDRHLQPRALFALESGALVLAMEEAEEGEGDRLFEYRPGQAGFAALASGEPARKLRALGLLKGGNLCLQLLNREGSEAGALLQYDGRSIQPLPDAPPAALGTNLYCAFSSRNGDLWTGSELGTACFHDKKWRVFMAQDKSMPEGVTCFAELADGKIWCGTSDQLWEFDGRNWAVVRRGFDHINALQAARDGSVWVASNGGLYRHFQGAWVENGLEEGLPSTSVRAVLEDSRGQLWAATSHGLSLFHPDADPDPPQTTVFPLSDSGDNLPAAGIITVNFRAQDKWKYTPPDRLLYSWRRDEQDWSPFQEMTHVPFADLSAGKHVFQVRAMDRNCNIEAKAQREFAIILPWYKETRLVLISLGGLAAALFFAGLAFNRHRQLLHSYAEVEQKVAERSQQLEMANRELVQSQKMNALGTLAAGIAHDFNNILSIIKGSAQIIEDNLDNPHKIRTRTERIRTVVEQGAGIVKAMLGFSRQSEQSPAPCELNAVVSETLKLLGDRFLREVELRFEPGADLPPLVAPKDLIQQILLNFLFNAAESVSGNRQIILRTALLEKLPPDLVLHPASNGCCLSLSVQDFGCGISSENLPRIFEPFFTTKALSARRGTGLGLSMVYELAKKLGAGLAVASRLDRGSTFTLILPALELSPDPQPSL
jgi:signal transduction histidine kinase